MPGILIGFSLLLLAMIFGWFRRKAGIFLFWLTLSWAGLVFLIHAQDHLGFYL